MTEKTPTEKTPAEIIQPSRYHILVEIVKALREIRGIAIPDERARLEDQASQMGKVLSMGPDCFMNLDVHPPVRRGTPACKVGDVVMFRSYTGTKVALRFTEGDFRLIVDDAIEGVIADPDLVRRGE